MDKNTVEKIVLKFLETTVHNQGSISIQNLTGHFSQLPADIRNKFNSTKVEVKKFLLAYPHVFIVNNEIVSLSSEKGQSNLMVPALVNVEEGGDGDDEGDDDNNDYDDGSGGSDETAVKRTDLIDCKGKIIRKFDMYGFIEYSSSSTLTSTIYFDVACFEDGQTETFKKLKLNDEVSFNAKPSYKHKAEYCAIKVWRCGHPMSLKGLEICYSSSTSLTSQDSYQSDTLNGSGIVMKITANYGFIKPAGKVQGNIFFFRTKLRLPNGVEVINLEDVVKKGDFLYFSAIPSKKKNADARWEAKKVSRTPIKSSCTSSLQNSDKNNRVRTGSTSSSDCSFVSSGFDTDRIIDENHIYDQVGNIQNVSSNEPSILFGKNKTAVVPQNVIYKNNSLVQEVGWELDEGTKVQFNAVCVNSDSDWRATLVWVGEKPILATKKSHKKKNTKIKQSTISGLCEISLYDDNRSDDGVWHTSRPKDVSSWDNENSENWPALEPPLSTKNKSAEKVKLSEAENNSKVPKSELINTLFVKNDEKSNDETSSDGSKRISKSEKSHKKQRTCDAFSYATAVTASSRYGQQSQNDSNSELERLKRYKLNNGWEKDSFDANSEKWPAIHEPLIAKPVARTSKETFKELNRKQYFTPDQMPNKSEYSNFVKPNSDLQENYYSDDENSCDIVSDYSYNKNLTVMSSHPLNILPQKIRYDKFSDVIGVVTNIQKFFAFIKYSESDQNLIFCWEQVFCDGQLVSKYYSDLHKVFNELDEVNFTYCRMIDENGKEWTNVLQVWKGEKPLLLTAECVKRNEAVPQLGSINTASNKAVDIPAAAVHAATKSSTELLPAVVAVQNKSSTEDSGISTEEAETNENHSKSTSSVCSSTSSIPNATASWNKEKRDKLSAVDFLVNELRTADESSQKEKTTCDAVSKFLNSVLGLTHSSEAESASCNAMPQVLVEGKSITTGNQQTQTEEVTTHEEGAQTFITGTVLSIAVFPQ